MNPQQEALLHQLESQVRQLTHRMSDINFAIHSLRSGNQPPPFGPTPIPALNPRGFDAIPPNPYVQGGRPDVSLPWGQTHSYSPWCRDQSRPTGFIKPDTMSHVFFYEQDCYVLSNFSAFRIEWKGREFDTSEAAYHWEKFPDHSMIQHEIQCARSAHDAYKIAERNRDKRRSDWDVIKVNIMKDILIAKVSQHEYVKQKLLETGVRTLVEDSWRDDFWGWGPNRTGQNMLGRLWMEIRREIQTSYREAPKKSEVETPPKLPEIVMVTADYVEANRDLLNVLVKHRQHIKHSPTCPYGVGRNCECAHRIIVEALTKVADVQKERGNIIGQKPGSTID